MNEIILREPMFPVTRSLNRSKDSVLAGHDTKIETADRGASADPELSWLQRWRAEFG